MFVSLCCSFRTSLFKQRVICKVIRRKTEYKTKTITNNHSSSTAKLITPEISRNTLLKENNSTMYISRRLQQYSTSNKLLLLTILTSIARYCLCGVITETNRHHRGSSNEENEEVARQTQKMLKKLLDGLGMKSIPKNVMPRGDIPEILLRDMISADDEEQEKAIDDAQYETTDDKFQKKKIMVFGNIGRFFFVLFCYHCFRHCCLS